MIDNIYIAIIPVVLGLMSNLGLETKNAALVFEHFFITLLLPFFMFFLVAAKNINIVSILENAGTYYLITAIYMFILSKLYSKSPFIVVDNVGALVLGASFSNLILVGVPLMMWLKHDELLSTIYAIIPLHSVALFIIATGINMFVSQVDESQLKVKISPLSWALILGLVLSQFNLFEGININEPKEVLTIFLQGSSLFVIGSQLLRYRINMNELKPAFVIAANKVIIMPLFFILILWPFFPALASKLAILASLPVGLNILGFVGNNKGSTRQTLSLAIAISTCASVVSVPLIFYFISVLASTSAH